VGKHFVSELQVDSGAGTEIYLMRQTCGVAKESEKEFFGGGSYKGCE
jgi:hypothetical protein